MVGPRDVVADDSVEWCERHGWPFNSLMMLCLVRRPGVFVGAVGGSRLDYRYKLSIVQALSLYL